MEKHLFVAVSDQLSAMFGIRFVSQFFSNRNKMKLTLFYTAPKPLDTPPGERDSETMKLDQKRAMEYEEKGRQALENAMNELLKSGFVREQINSRFHVSRISKVTDLIHEGEKGLYDAVVLGRRGLTWLEEAFQYSLSKDLMEKRFNFPLWFCRRTDKERKNVLVCVDGSEAAYRMVDHVGFMLKDEQQHGVTILLVRKDKERDQERAEGINSKSKELLVDHGLSPDVITSEVVVSDDVVKSILKASDEGKFAVVALGRRKAEQSLLKKMFTGSVSSKLFREMKNSALWVCH